MKLYTDIEYKELEPNKDYNDLINKVITQCFEIENLTKTKLYVSVILTTKQRIKTINQQFRNTNQATDVLSFPMFEKEEIKTITEEEALGDIIICVEKVEEQAKEYGHSFERELAYMLEEEKNRMRQKEENVLAQLNIIR